MGKWPKYAFVINFINFFLCSYSQRLKGVKAGSLVNQGFRCLLSNFSFHSLLHPVHNIEREAECCNFERSLNILFYILHVVHTTAPSSPTWSNRARQRFLPLFLLCFTTVEAELVTSDNGHHPLYIVQNDKTQYVNPWQMLSFSSFQVGFVWSLGCAQRAGWMKTCCHWESSAEKAFLASLAESMDTTPLGLQAVLPVFTEFMFISSWFTLKAYFWLPNTEISSLSVLVMTTKPSENRFVSSYIHQGEFNRTEFSEQGCTKCWGKNINTE